MLCDTSKKIGVVLELTADLPTDREIERWTGEPVKALVISTSIFVTNKKGFPVLSRAHQNVVRTFLKVRMRWPKNDKQLLIKLCRKHVKEAIDFFRFEHKRRTRILSVGIKYSACDVICEISNHL